jgi:hypothetical protein
MSVGQINLWRNAVAEATKTPVGEFMWFRRSLWPFYSTATFAVKL